MKKDVKADKEEHSADLGPAERKRIVDAFKARRRPTPEQARTFEEWRSPTPPQ